MSQKSTRMTNWTKHRVIHGENDNCPTLRSASSAQGESGISVLRLRFAGRLQYAATLLRHFEVRFAQSLSDEPIKGTDQ
jgi:hypothetical protein